MPAPSRGAPRDFTAAGLGVIHAMTMLRIAEVETPIGPMYCAVRDGRLCALEFAERWPHRLVWLERRLGAFFTHPDPDRRPCDRGGAGSRPRPLGPGVPAGRG